MTRHDSPLSLWWLAVRPKTLPAAAAPVVVGTAAAMAEGVFMMGPALAAFLGALLLQIAVNLANDYFDAKNSIDSAERLGPVRVTQSGLIPAGQVKTAMILSLVLASLVFLYLTAVGGMVLFLAGVASVLAALAYSGGPYPLASHGLGELFVFLFFGLVAVCGTYWVQALHLTPFVVAVSLPPGLLVSAIMVVNNLRDRDTDARAGKHTLAVRLGRSRTLLLYRLLLGLPYGVPVCLLAWDSSAMGLSVLLPFLTAPTAFSLGREIGLAAGSELNALLARTAKLSLAFCLLFSFGIVL